MVAKSRGSVSPHRVGDRVMFFWDDTCSKYGSYGSFGNRPKLEDLQYRTGIIVDMDYRAIELGKSVYEIDVEFDAPIKVPNGKPIRTLGGMSSDHFQKIIPGS